MRNLAVRWVPLILACATSGVWAGSHTWDVHEIYSNASGTIQFIELWEADGGASEEALPGHTITSLTVPHSFTIPPPVLTTPTTRKRVLFATAAFAALPGAPTPNYIIASSFLSTVNDTISYDNPFWDDTTYTAGELPTDGIRSFYEIVAAQSNAPATPTNYLGQTFAPPGTKGLLVKKNNPSGASLDLTWDARTCLGARGYHIVSGFGSGLPAAPGGVFTLQPTGFGQCGITDPFKTPWSSSLDPVGDPTRLLWFLVVADNGPSTALEPHTPVEGSWGLDRRTNGSEFELIGPGTGGASAQCTMTTKSLANTCAP